MYRLCEYIFECEFLRGIRDTDIVFLWKITFLNYCSSYFIVEAKTNFCRAHCFENILCWYAGTQGEAITHKFIYIAWFFENHYITASPIAFFLLFKHLLGAKTTGKHEFWLVILKMYINKEKKMSVRCIYNASKMKLNSNSLVKFQGMK